MFTRRLFVALAPALILPRAALSVGAGTSVTGKSRPVLGVILLDAATQTGDTLNADLLLHGGGGSAVVASAAFEAPWPLARGLYYDVEAKGEKGSAFLQVLPLPAGTSLGAAPKSFFTKGVLGLDGRFGAYGAPSDVKVTADVTDAAGGARRALDFGFTTLSPGGAELAWRGTMVATTPQDSTDALVCVSSATVARWRAGGEALARKATASLRVAARPTRIAPVASSDVVCAPPCPHSAANPRDRTLPSQRFERLGGLLEGGAPAR